MEKKYKIIITIFFLILIYLIFYTLIAHFYLKDQIIIGTKNFTEQNIIGYLLEDVVEDNSEYKVKVLPGIGETSFLQEAILKGDIDVYVDYTSTAYTTILNHKYDGQSNREIKKDIKKEYNNKFNLDWVSFLGFNNSNAIICKDFCKENNIKTISDLVNHSGNYSFAAPNFFYDRSDGFKILEDAYGIRLDSKDKFSMDSSMVYRAIDNGQIDVGLGYTTDGKLSTGEYTILEDDKNAYPQYDAGVIISNTFLKENPQIKILLEKTNNSITIKQMQKMNYKVDVEGENPQQVADEFYQNTLKDELDN